MPTQENTRAARADRTRAAILEAAQNRFTELGYDRATVRLIAGDAGIDPSLVIRHFGSKEQLFLAASSFDLGLMAFAEISRANLGKALAKHFFAVWEGGQSGAQLRMLLGSSLTDRRAAERLQSIFHEQLLPAIRHARSDRHVEECAGMVASQVLGFALTRYVLKIDSVEALSRADAIDWLGASIQQLLDHVAERPKD